MDASLDSGPETSDSGDLPVNIGTLELDGTRPTVGDQVEVRVGGIISQIVDETAFVTPQTCNDAPMPPKVQATDDQQMQAAANEAGLM